MKIYISVVSHGHSELINKISCLSKLSNSFEVVVKSNKPGDDFSADLNAKNFHWLNQSYYSGFGRNNNIVYNYCVSDLGMKDEDYFVILNPDVDINTNSLMSLITKMNKSRVNIATINLFRDYKFSKHDNSIRKFPRLIDFVSSFIGLKNKSVITKESITKSCSVDWAAGSFLAFSSKYFRLLNGFDECYFMYCEDIDICYRSSKLGNKVIYYPSIKAVHLAKHANRKLLSKHFVWHVKSVIRFLVVKRGLTTSKSCIGPSSNR
ncbi:glycosyl transferase, family 2 [Vibrio diabolicus E0666]|uniref:glycosyltransferase family 2 protein n=1 Tax=Vibrio diabolicus TaxID=50719 RepID=UPI0002B70A8B|nr:glycosyltransferase family 2 protein [Vibrio diabolicus]EMD78538.1 glycosyl transferase, family 2 [Vibrio diabolicus E0666]